MHYGVVYHKQLGDLVLLQPALAWLAAESRGEVFLFTRPEFKALEPLFPHTLFCQGKPGTVLDRLDCLDDGSRSLKRALRIRCRERRLLVPVPERRRWWHRFFFDGTLELSPAGRYRAFYYLDALGGTSARTAPSLLPPPESWKPSSAPAHSYTLLHLTSGWRRKSWPATHWIGLARQLLRSGHAFLVLTAGTKEHELEIARAVRQALADDSRVLALAGQTTLQEYLWLIHHARLAITVDGSASHLAAAWQRPCITLFGPTDPAEWHFPQPGQQALFNPQAALPDRRAEDIPVTQVLDSVKTLGVHPA